MGARGWDIEWAKARLAEGWLGPDFARHWGISTNAARQRIKQNGLAFCPQALARWRAGAGARLAKNPNRIAAVAAYLADPVKIAERTAIVLEANSRPDVRAKKLAALERARSPDSRARAGRSISERALADIPPAYRDEHRRLVKSKRIPAAESRQLISIQVEHDKRKAQQRFAEELRARAEAMRTGGGRARISPTLESASC